MENQAEKQTDNAVETVTIKSFTGIRVSLRQPLKPHAEGCREGKRT